MAENKMSEAMRATVGSLLKGIDRYNPENLERLERYVDMQARENTYDLEANLAVLKLYQFNPGYYQAEMTSLILLKALTNLPHTDFMLCKCLIDTARLEEEPLKRIVNLALQLETCQFKDFWEGLRNDPEIIAGIVGFGDCVRKYVCHVVSATYQTIPKSLLQELLGGIADFEVNQWITKYGWVPQSGNMIFIMNQDDSIKTKNITEKITFDSVAAIMATSL